MGSQESKDMRNATNDAVSYGAPSRHPVEGSAISNAVTIIRFASANTASQRLRRVVSRHALSITRVNSILRRITFGQHDNGWFAAQKRRNANQSPVSINHPSGVSFS